MDSHSPHGTRGRVLEIYVADRAGAPMRAVRRVRAIAGCGLEGDRYALALGRWSERTAKGRRDLTLIAQEDLEALAGDGIELLPSESRRNILTSGVDLASLIGKRFRVGDAICYGIRRCQPCDYLEARTRPGVLRGLVDRGGLFAEIVGTGAISVGDAIWQLGAAEEMDFRTSAPIATAPSPLGHTKS